MEKYMEKYFVNLNKGGKLYLPPLDNSSDHEIREYILVILTSDGYITFFSGKGEIPGKNFNCIWELPLVKTRRFLKLSDMLNWEEMLQIPLQVIGAVETMAHKKWAIVKLRTKMTKEELSLKIFSGQNYFSSKTQSRNLNQVFLY